MAQSRQLTELFVLSHQYIGRDWAADSPMSAGCWLTVALLSDGTAKAYGRNHVGQKSIPHLKPGVRYTQVSAGRAHTLLLCSDGTVVACGRKRLGRRHRRCHRCSIPRLRGGLRYAQVSAGDAHSVLLLSDGTLAAYGRNDQGQCEMQEAHVLWNEGFTQVSAGGFHTLALQHGFPEIYACGRNREGQCNIPRFEEELTYSQASTGSGCFLISADCIGPPHEV